MATTKIAVNSVTWTQIADASQNALLVTWDGHGTLEVAATDTNVAPTTAGHRLHREAALSRANLGSGYVWAKLVGGSYPDTTNVIVTVGSDLAVKSGAGGNVTVSVAAAGSLSAAVDLGNQRLGRIGLPADIGTSTYLAFKTSHDNVTFKDLYDGNGTRYRIPVAANRSVVPDLSMFAAARYLKLQFEDTAGAASAYANQRDMNLATLA